MVFTQRGTWTMRLLELQNNRQKRGKQDRQVIYHVNSNYFCNEKQAQTYYQLPTKYQRLTISFQNKAVLLKMFPFNYQFFPQHCMKIAQFVYFLIAEHRSPLSFICPHDAIQLVRTRCGTFRSWLIHSFDIQNSGISGGHISYTIGPLYFWLFSPEEPLLLQFLSYPSSFT